MSSLVLVHVATWPSVRLTTGGSPFAVAPVQLHEPAVDALEFLPSVPGVREVTLYGTLLHVLVDDDLAPDRLVSVLRANGLQDSSIRQIKPTLEDVFVSRIRAGGSP